MIGEYPPDEIFADTCVLLNFVQREWEPDKSVDLVESKAITVVVSRNVVDELADVTERRRDVYEDFLDFLLETEDGVEAYDPSDRRVYLAANDAKHVRNLQMQLASLDDRLEVLRRLRQFVRAAGRRVEYLEDLLEDTTVDPVVSFDLRLAIDRLLDHSADTKVVTDAAAWTADGGSGILVTRDADDLLDNEDSIVEILVEKQGPDWAIDVVTSETVLAQLQLPERTD